MLSNIDNQSELLRSLFDNSPLLYVLWDPHIRKFVLNPYAEKVIGWTTEEANSMDFMSAIYPEKSYRESVISYMQSLEPGYREWIIKTKSGENIPIDWANMKLRNDVMVGIGVDLREQKRVEFERSTNEKLKILNAELKRSNDDLQQFANVASHDLQEPLRTVSSFTQLLQQKYNDKLDDEAKEYINYAVAGSKRMYNLINGLLDYSRVQTKENHYTSVDMNKVLEKVKYNLLGSVGTNGSIISSENLPVIHANESQMIQLMQNLLDNAVKFCKKNPVIRIDCKTLDGFYVFSVKDNGIGIDPEYFPKIFKMFQRLHTNEYPGTGIGLSICQRIIERNAGKIWVESELNEGSVFYFSIPC
jgi:PAS domain S-box-containing protein